LFILQQFSLVAALDNFGQNQHGDDKVKSSLTHGLDFVASQFHPEFKSKPNKPHPLFEGFIAATHACGHGKST